MKRIYHSYEKWEDYRHNFYGGMGSYQHDGTLQMYAQLLNNLPQFEQALRLIIDTWAYSCEHNLSNESMNRIAYLGQAACALMYKVPHNVCMGGYNLLSDDAKRAADEMALKYLNLWLEKRGEPRVDLKKV